VLRARPRPPWADAILLAAAAFCALDLCAHWHPYLRAAWDFLPASRGGYENEFVTLWVARFSRTLRSLPFTDTFWLVNLRGPADVYSSHPGFLSFLASAWQDVFGEGPLALRRLAIALFALRLALLHDLTRRWRGPAAAWLAVLLYLAVPATLGYAQALSFEVVAGTFTLAAFWALPFSAGAASLLFAAAVATDWPALLALPFLLRASPRKIPVAAAAAVALAATYFWAQRFVGHSEAALFLTRVRNFLLGPFYVLPYNPAARALLGHRLAESFPLFVLLPFLWSFREGWRGRPAWWWAAFCAGGLYVLCFLGVFRVHAYLSQLLITALVAGAAPAWLELARKRKALCAGLALLALGEAAHGFRPPWSSRRNALLREAFRREAEAAYPFVAGHAYRFAEREPELRGKPLEMYWPGARLELGGCPELTARFREEGDCAGALYRGNLLCVEKSACR
jgi:hypothetical protein